MLIYFAVSCTKVIYLRIWNKLEINAVIHGNQRFLCVENPVDCVDNSL